MTAAFEALLEVQERDTEQDQLRHRLEAMPERAALLRLEEELAALEGRRTEAIARRDEVLGRQLRLEDELATLESRIAGLDQRLYSGSVTLPRELQALQADIESLKKHRGTLEDEVLEVMTEREPLDAAVEALDGERARLDAEGERLRAAVAESSVDIEAELAAAQEARARALPAVPSDLLSLYERLRDQLGGVGVARLVRGSCGGCHLALPATEVDRIKHQPPDALVRCDQCGRILVRES